MFTKISQTWELMGASWSVLKQDFRLLLFPLISGISCVIVLLSFLLPMWASGLLEPPAEESSAVSESLYWVLIFSFYVVNYFVITFFNVAIVSCAISYMAGGEPTISGGLSEAFKRIHLIFGWALVSATVGLILRIIEERSQMVGKIIAGILGAAWTLMTFLVVPILVVEEKGPIDAMKESGRLFTKTWGEQIVGNFSFGLIFFALAIPGAAAVIFGGYLFTTGNAVPGAAVIGLGVLYLIATGLIQSALQSIFQAALYMHTQEVGGVRGFPVHLLNDSVAPRD